MGYGIGFELVVGLGNRVKRFLGLGFKKCIILCMEKGNGRPLPHLSHVELFTYN